MPLPKTEHCECSRCVRHQPLLAKKLPGALAAILAVLTAIPLANAQLEGRLAERPLGSGFTRNMTQATTLNYAKSLATRLEVGKSLIEQIPNSEISELGSKIKEPINGVAYYLVQGLIPSWETVYFQQVVDEADALRMLEKRKSMFGQNGTLERLQNNCFISERRNSWNQPIPEGQDPEKFVEQQKASLANSGSRSFRRTVELVEEGGKPQLKNTWVNTEYFRLHDQLLFSANFEELHTMVLPDAESLTRAGRGENDMGIEVFFNRVPEGIKQLGWGMLSSTAGVQMQQRDEEEETIAELRSTSIQFGLDLLKSIIFDVDEAKGWLRFADDDDYSVRAQINFAARRNSRLSEELQTVSEGNSRFGPILKDDAPITIHLCTKLFQENDLMVLAAGRWLETAIQDIPNHSAQTDAAAAEIARTLESVAQHRTLEVLLKAGWSEDSDGAIYGGIQLDSNPALLRSLLDLALSLPGRPEDVISMVEKDGEPAIEVLLPEEFTEQIQQETGMTLTRAWLAHRNSCLWFCLGGERSFEMLRQSMDRCGEQSLAVRTPLFTAHLHAEKWLQLPQDDPVGIGGLLTWLDANQSAFPPGPMMRAFGQDSKPTPILQQVIDLGGDRDASMTVISDNSGLQANIVLGEALANYLVARQLDSQDRMMRSRQQAQENAAKAQKEAQEATPKQE